MSLRYSILTLLAALVWAVPAQAQNTDFDVWIDDVELRPGITTDLHVMVYVNEKHPCSDKTIVALHGAWGGHGYYEGVAEELFADNPTGRKVCRVAAIDLPGHAGPPLVGSTVPDGGLLFGELTMDDYATALLAALSRLPELGVHTKTLWGHSMGGLVVQMAQQQLLDQGTNLRREFNTKKVLLTGTVPPAPVPYALGESYSELVSLFYWCFTGPGGGIPPGCPGWLDAGGDNDIDFADLGLLVPPPDQWDCDPLTTPVGDPPLPAAQNCDSSLGLGDHSLYEGFQTYRESLTAIFQILGVLQYQRPVVEAGAFGPRSRTRLWVVSFEHDEWGHAVYEHLTGDETLEDHLLVMGPEAIHDMALVYPREFLDAIAGVVELP